MVASPHFGHLEPMLIAVQLEGAGVTETPEVVSRTPASGTSSRWNGSPPRAPGASARRTQAAARALGWLERRTVRIHAPRPGFRARGRALPTTTTTDRADLRSHQVQPPDRAVSTDAKDRPSERNGA